MPREIAHCKASLGKMSLVFSPSRCKYLKLLWSKLCFLVETLQFVVSVILASAQSKKKSGFALDASYCSKSTVKLFRVLFMPRILSNIWSKIFEDLRLLTSVVLDSVDFNCMKKKIYVLAFKISLVDAEDYIGLGWSKLFLFLPKA